MHACNVQFGSPWFPMDWVVGSAGGWLVGVHLMIWFGLLCWLGLYVLRLGSARSVCIVKIR